MSKKRDELVMVKLGEYIRWRPLEWVCEYARVKQKKLVYTRSPLVGLYLVPEDL